VGRGEDAGHLELAGRGEDAGRLELAGRGEGRRPPGARGTRGGTSAAWSSRDEGRVAGRLELAGRGEDAGARDKRMDAGAQDEGRDAAADGGRGKRGGRRRGMRGGRRRRTTARDDEGRTRDPGAWTRIAERGTWGGTRGGTQIA
jgi:hypothetical protein